ncbi:daunorubicin resistance protein DrrA family ABC transporter ATP-binding protein [Haloglycomyces albus]|uniref:daunorubicin resistance protein DrrA family ABC transporter ATP-binding protein n=1 Tax=Haloglycomyces albus TaxID=526067 RepID=UPI00046D0A70|nr:daunorubicin resistance protein DrrA family ABC transporter ATP-binding protein [Haloglycomyces albus]
MPTTIAASGLRKQYSGKTALDDLDLDVESGSVHGLLGPNGAGKTTTVRILSTLLRFDAGSARVAGFDVTTQERQVRASIGLAGQETTLDDVLTARQNLVYFGKLYHLPKPEARSRAEELLHQFDLSEVADASPKTFSGGMRRRLDLAASMIRAPKVLFLDEPTTGLDPGGRRDVWSAVENLAHGGTTVLLTTHYLDEADRLCDQVSVVDNGRKVAEDSPTALKRAIGGERLEVVATDPDDLPILSDIITTHTGQFVQIDEERLRLSSGSNNPIRSLTAVAGDIREKNVDVADFGLRRATLDEAFLTLTGDRSAGNAT